MAFNEEPGTTSAYAEKRLPPAIKINANRNYLRIRGEKP
ncbi:Hypothetical protein Cul210932_0032 [Corynebacterium ulcerans]|nr:Hypothetical protein Cul210932_0032 [Corynebacterium ulcerans]